MVMSTQEHEQHMENVKTGLQQILESNDLNEIKRIAQNLLQEEQAESAGESSGSSSSGKGGMKASSGVDVGGLRDKLTKAMEAGGGM